MPNHTEQPESSWVIDHRYRIERRIGVGGMGAVYRARELSSQVPMAVKVLRPEYVDCPKHRRRFLREARVAMSICHPNVVSVVDFGIDQGQAFIVMEYLHGQSLATKIRRESPLPWTEAREILCQAISGLRAVHDIGVLHRDIKPSNLFLTRSGEGKLYTVKVLDFGIAKAVDPDSSLADTLTHHDDVVGTARYMSPERAYGEPATAASDVYALGVVAFEMLTGQEPLPARSVVGMLRRRATEPPPSPAEIAPELPPAVDRLVRKAMARDPAERFGSLSALEEAVKAIEADDDPGGSNSHGRLKTSRVCTSAITETCARRKASVLDTRPVPVGPTPKRFGKAPMGLRCSLSPGW